MRPRLVIFLGALLLALAACAPAGESSPTPAPASGALSWRYEGTEPPQVSEVPVPETYRGRTYDQVLAAALEYNQGPSYELVWGSPSGTSPGGTRAVYAANKDDLTRPELAMMLLNLSTGEERMLFQTESRMLYPRGWLDEDRFLYEEDGAYFLCGLSAPENLLPLSLPGDKPVLLAQDGGVLIYAEDADALDRSPRFLARVTESGSVEVLAEYSPGSAFLMAECAVSEAQHTAAFKVRESNDSPERGLVLFDYESGEAVPVPSPAGEDGGAVSVISFWWDGPDLVAECRAGSGGETETGYWRLTAASPPGEAGL